MSLSCPDGVGAHFLSPDLCCWELPFYFKTASNPIICVTQLHLIHVPWLTLIMLTLDHSLTLLHLPAPKDTPLPTSSLQTSIARPVCVVHTHTAMETEDCSTEKPVREGPMTDAGFKDHSWVFPTPSNILSDERTIQKQSWHEPSKELL